MRVAEEGRPTLVNLIFVGDSITFGQYVDPNLRWTSLIAHRFDETFAETSVHVFTANRSAPGDTTRMALEKFPADVQRWSPDILFIDYGMNDCNCWSTDHGVPRVSEAAFRANLQEMIARGRVFGASEIILATKTRSLKRKVMLNGLRYEDANTRYSEIIREVAGEANVTLFDPRRSFDALSVDALAEKLLPYPDVIHLSPKGHAWYAELSWPILRAAVNAILGAKAAAGISA